MFERSLHLPGMMQKYRNSTRSDRWKRGSCKSAGISLVFARIRRSLEKMMQMRSNFVTFPLTLLKLLHFCRNAAGAIAAPPYKARLGATGAMLLPLCKAAQLGASGAMPLTRLRSWARRAMLPWQRYFGNNTMNNTPRPAPLAVQCRRSLRFASCNHVSPTIKVRNGACCLIVPVAR